MTIATTTPQDGDGALSEVVATRIRGLMAERRLTQLDVSRALNVSRSGVSDRLNGVKPVNLNELPALAHLFETSIDYLLGLTDVRSPRRSVTGGGSLFLPFEEGGTPSGTRTPNPLIKSQGSLDWEGGQVIPLHPRPTHEQVDQPTPAVVVPLFPMRRGDVAETCEPVAS